MAFDEGAIKTLNDNAKSFGQRMGDSLAESSKVYNEDTKSKLKAQADKLTQLPGDMSLKMTNSWSDWGSATDENGKINLRGIDTGFRDKFKMSCPAFVTVCGKNTVDFGQLFMDDAQTNALHSIESLVSDALSVTQTLIDTISPETANALMEAVMYVVTDTMNTVLSYLEYVITTYLSPNYLVTLGRLYANEYMDEFKRDVKDPKELLEQIMDMDGFMDRIKSDDQEEALKKVQNDCQSKFSKAMADATKWVKDTMQTIEPYRTEIMKYMQYGPDYAIEQLEILYKKYLTKGMNYVHEKVTMVDKEVKKAVNHAAQESAKAAAEEVNQEVIAQLKKLADEAQVKKAMLELKAKAFARKAILKLKATFGG